MDQPTAAPTAKVTTATIAGALGILLVWIAGELDHPISAEVAAAIVTVLAFAGGYFKRETGPVGADDRGAAEPLTLLVYVIVIVILIAVLFAVLDRI